MSRRGVLAPGAAKGRCKAHSRRLRQHGDVGLTEIRRHHIRRLACAVDGCEGARGRARVLRHPLEAVAEVPGPTRGHSGAAVRA